MLLLLALVSANAAALPEPELPLASGTYVFQHRFAEHPTLPSIQVTVHLDGRHIRVENEHDSSVFPKGTLDEGTLMWHDASGQWIIGESEVDRQREDVGGCSDGPQVVDLAKREFWTC